MDQSIGRHLRMRGNAISQHHRAPLLCVVVEKAKKCLDFGATLFIFHLLACWTYEVRCHRLVFCLDMFDSQTNEQTNQPTKTGLPHHGFVVVRPDCGRCRDDPPGYVRIWRCFVWVKRIEWGSVDRSTHGLPWLSSLLEDGLIREADRYMLTYILPTNQRTNRRAPVRTERAARHSALRPGERCRQLRPGTRARHVSRRGGAGAGDAARQG